MYGVVRENEVELEEANARKAEVMKQLSQARRHKNVSAKEKDVVKYYLPNICFTTNLSIFICRQQKHKHMFVKLLFIRTDYDRKKQLLTQLKNKLSATEEQSKVSEEHLIHLQNMYILTHKNILPTMQHTLF